MRIVYVLNTLVVGGTERQVLGIASRMAGRGHDVALLVLRAREPDWFPTDLEVVPLEMRKSAVGLWTGLRRGVEFLRVFRPDILHSHNFHGNMLARLMRLSYPQTKLIATIHNVYEGGRLRMLAYRMSDGLTCATTAVSEAVARRYTGGGAVRNGKCVVLTNGIEMSALSPQPGRRTEMRRAMMAGDAFIWLAVGRRVPAKDHPNLLGAFNRVSAAVPGTRLWIAGDAGKSGNGSYDKSLLKTYRSPQVLWLGSRQDVPALLDAADGFVLSSAWEGMPLALGEAMAMEKPVVATDVGGVRELVGNTGTIVPAQNSIALAEAMLDVMGKTNQERTELGRLGRGRIAQRFSMDAKAEEWEALYRSVLA